MSIYQQALQEQIEENFSNIEELDSMIGKGLEPDWYEPIPLTEDLPRGTGKTGVYKIFHVEDLTTALVIGKGNLSGRKSRHKGIMNRKGIPKSHSPGSAATKMYKYDPTIDNWYFSWCELPKSIITKYEKLLIESEKPKFSLVSMAGL